MSRGGGSWDHLDGKRIWGEEGYKKSLSNRGIACLDRGGPSLLSEEEVGLPGFRYLSSSGRVKRVLMLKKKNEQCKKSLN